MARFFASRRCRSCLVHLARRIRWLRNVISPAVPEMVTLSYECLECLTPFFMLLDSRGRFLASGASIHTILNDSTLQGSPVAEIVDVLDGAEKSQIVVGDLLSLAGQLLRLELKARPGLEFAGQLIPAWKPTDQNHRFHPDIWILDLRPILETLDDLEASGLSLQDLSLLDPMRVSMVTMLMDASMRQDLLEELREAY